MMPNPRRLERRLDCILDPLEPDELELLTGFVGDVTEVLAVACGQNHALPQRTRRQQASP